MARLNIKFSTISPDIDESTKNGEKADVLAMRLAIEKATYIANDAHDSIVIGSDQTVDCEGEILGKPGNIERARTQLQQVSGKPVVFNTGLCVINTATKQVQQDNVKYSVIFRELALDEIDRYLEIDKPFNCAGSFKSESLGIALLEKMTGDDPTALIGLPLIRLTEMLRKTGLTVP